MFALARVFGSISNHSGAKLLLHHQSLGFIGAFHDVLLISGSTLYSAHQIKQAQAVFLAPVSGVLIQLNYQTHYYVKLWAPGEDFFFV